MRSKLVFVLVALLLVTAAAEIPFGGEEVRRARAEVYALEGLAAFGGLVGCGCLGAGGAAVLLIVGGAELGANGGYERGNPYVVGAGVGVALASAAAMPAAAGYGATKVGERLGEYGSTGWAVGGAYVGTAVGLGFVGLGVAANRHQAASIPLYVLGGLSIPTGAVLGYNLGPKREALRPMLWGRLQPPGVALTGAKLPDHSVEYGVKVQLAGLRF